MRVLDFEQGTDEWRAARTGVITGTKLKSVLGTTSRSLMFELIASQLAPEKESIQSEAMERGVELESDAVAVYEMTTGNQTTQVGFVLHEEYDWLGVSPDSLVKVDGEYRGAVEVKCPDTKTHIKYIENDKIPSEYRAQVMQYFLVCDTLEWLDFVSYDPRINVPELQLFIKRITRDELQDELKVAMGKVLDFRKKWEKLITKYIF
jgi:putative phage-type endonuclease